MQLKENVYRVEYRVSAFTSQAQLDRYLRHRCAELTLREGYDFFYLARRAGSAWPLTSDGDDGDAVQRFKTPPESDLYDAKDVLAESRICSEVRLRKPAGFRDTTSTTALPSRVVDQL